MCGQRHVLVAIGPCRFGDALSQKGGGEHVIGIRNHVEAVLSANCRHRNNSRIETCGDGGEVGRIVNLGPEVQRIRKSRARKKSLERAQDKLSLDCAEFGTNG